MSNQITQAAVDGLRNDFGGQIILPGDLGYDGARTIFNAMIDRRPGVIAQCANANDVVRAIHFGRELGLEIAVRGGGHSVAGKALTDGGLVIDLRRMNAVSVDPQARTAIVAGGATMSDLDRATGPHGLGDDWRPGFDHRRRRLHSGRRRRLARPQVRPRLRQPARRSNWSPPTAASYRAQRRENPELFWALHGGGGNFGVATSLTFRLHPLQSVTAALLLWRPEPGRRYCAPTAISSSRLRTRSAAASST